jgi:ubiquinone/menaquinone biosynthesis C-methylase UbiE
MLLAMNEKNCNVHGIDPQTGTLDGKVSNNGLSIMQGVAEKILFEKGKFDVVFSSHVLEHVDDETKSLREISRVLKDNGVLVIGMPTSQMAWINLWTELLFTTHQRMFNFLFGRLSFISTSHTPFINVFIPFSHSTHRAKTVLFDLKYYKIENWKKIIEKEFKIEKVILPAFYPYPKYRQFFKMKKNYKKSSSVFFICSKLN